MTVEDRQFLAEEEKSIVLLQKVRVHPDANRRCLRRITELTMIATLRDIGMTRLSTLCSDILEGCQ